MDYDFGLRNTNTHEQWASSVGTSKAVVSGVCAVLWWPGICIWSLFVFLVMMKTSRSNRSNTFAVSVSVWWKWKHCLVGPEPVNCVGESFWVENEILIYISSFHFWESKDARMLAQALSCGLEATTTEWGSI